MLVDLNLGVLDTGGNPLLARQISSEELEMLPIIKMKDLTEPQTVFYDTIFIDVSAVGGNRIVRIEVTYGEPIIIRLGRNIFFNYLAQLEEGGKQIHFQGH